MDTLAPPELPPLLSFEQASARVLDFLRQTVRMGLWTVTRRDDDDQVFLTVRDDTYGFSDGAVVPWSASLCRAMTTGEGPSFAPDAMAVPAYASADAAASFPIGAYVGVPIRGGDGTLFGTLCGYDPQVQDVGLDRHAPLLSLLASMLGQILQSDRMHAEAVAREVELRRRASRDLLTGLANRGLLADRLGAALERHRQDRHPVSVLVLDLDGFKAVNDTYGHAAGDELLVQVAQRLTSETRPQDLVARLSGDEFAVLVESGGDAPALAARVVAAAAEPFVLAEAEVGIGVSVGVTCVAADAPTPTADDLLSHADAAMYDAKRSGKGRFTVHDRAVPLPEARDLRLRAPLRQALCAPAGPDPRDPRDPDGPAQVCAVYQPLVELDGGHVTGVEALARWEHEGRSVAPGVFVPVAARSGLLPALTDHMLTLACDQLTRWSDDPLRRGLRVSVNVPASVVGSRTFPAEVAEHLVRAGVEPSRLVLELTEDALVHDHAQSRATTDALQELGVGLALDDFGTGRSTLRHLHQVRTGAVKVHRALVSEIETDPRSRQLLAALLAASGSLGTDVVVKGVERASQAQVLRDLGVRYAQGFWFARPLPADELSLPAVTRPRRGEIPAQT